MEGADDNQPRVEGGGQVAKGLIAGAVSGLTSRAFVYPFDTLKSQLYVQGAVKGLAPHISLTGAFRKVAATEGFFGFYRGFSVVLAGVMPGSMAYFGGYELGKSLVPADSGVLGNMATGAIAQIIAGVVFNPIDILKERMQVQPMMSGLYSYNSALQALRDLLRKEGGPGLLRGYWVTNSVWIPWNIMYIASYEASKAMVAKHICKAESPAEIPAWAISSCAAGSAAAAAVVTNPADVVKVRLQVLSAGAAKAITAASIAKQLWLHEGWKGLFAGTGARVMSIAPGCAISWLMYERIMQIL